jgi:hypothetical protein
MRFGWAKREREQDEDESREAMFFALPPPLLPYPWIGMATRMVIGVSLESEGIGRGLGRSEKTGTALFLGQTAAP